MDAAHVPVVEKKLSGLGSTYRNYTGINEQEPFKYLNRKEAQRKHSQSAQRILWLLCVNFAIFAVRNCFHMSFKFMDE